MIAMADKPTTEQLTTEQTGAQSPTVNPLLFGQGVLYASGGCASNPLNFPGYGGLYDRTYLTYRWMLQHPIVRLVRTISIAPILASYWQYKSADDTIPPARVELIKKMFDRLRQRAMTDILRGRDYGWAPFEPLWELRNGEIWLTELKPLTPEWTTILTDETGRFIGLQANTLENKGMTFMVDGKSFSGLPAPYKAWVYTYDRECGNLYGRSWLENIRETAWKDWLDCAQQLQKLSGSISGTQIIMKSPNAQKDQCIALVKALANGAVGGWVPSMLKDVKPGDNVDWTALAEMAKASVIGWELLDFGTRTPAIAGLLERMRHDEDLIFAGGLRPSRSGLEGKHGTKAEAGVHSDTGMMASELDDDDIASQLQPMVDAVLELNFGPDARGSVYIDPPPLLDSKSQRFSDFLTAISTNGDVSTALANYADVADLLDGLDIPIKEGAKFEIVSTKAAPVAPVDPNTPITRVSTMEKRLGKRLQKAG